MRGININILLILLVMIFSGCVERDVSGRLPTEIVSEFIVHVNSRDYAAAALCWRKGDVDVLELNHHMSFEQFCLSNFSSDSFRLEFSHAENGYVYIGFIGIKGEGEKRYTLAMEIVDGSWKLGASPNGSWTERALRERQALKEKNLNKVHSENSESTTGR